ncbi:hypothetical protein BOX15_Mlig028982g1 [Macrostomum lignano]|uniref:Chromo domain-containing protein n=1 Tax=Macrostomum lignano TaxID=282301 RepID=A0A267GW85_9PLAT|nr:hypothetical protein BOX15_Mlig028982g1 [Macrostomum lignano]
MGRSYRISKIIDKRKKQGRVEYRIRWTGFKSSQDTWEPATEIMPVAYRLVRDFHNRSKNSNNSASNASSPSSSKEQQPIDQGSPKKQQTQPRLPKLMALKQLQQSQPEPPQAQKLPQKQQTAAKLMRKKGGKQQPQRARVLALPKRKAKKRLQKLQPKQQKQQAKKNNQQKSADDASTVSASNPSSAASASSSSSSASSAASSAASSTVSPNSQPSQPPQPLPPSHQSQSPPLPIPSQMQQQQSELAALPSASIDWNLKYGLEGGSAPVTPRHLSPSSPSTAPVALIASAVDSPSALLAPASSPPLAPSPRPEQQQQQQQQSQPSLPQTPTSSSSDLRRYHAGVIDAIDSIRRLKRKVLLDRVVQAVCKKLRVGAGLAEAVIEDMVRIGRLKKVRCSTDNSLTLYLPNQKPRSVAVSTVSAKAKPKSQQQQQLQAKKTTHIRNNYHELFVKQPAHSPGVFEIWLVGPSNGTGQPGCCFTVRLMQELCRALQQALDNPACRLVRLANTDPRCFSRGVDLSSMLAAKPGQEASLAVNQLTDELQRLVSAMVEFPKLLVATVTGACVGLGAALLPLCDFVYASDSAYFYLPYAKLKQPCEAGVSYTLRQALGKPTASEMLLAGRKLTANEACTRGLVSSVIFADTFQQEAAVRCASIGASVGAENVRQTKALMHSTSRSSVIQACQAECLALRSYWLRDDARQLMREFLGEDRDLLERAEASVL